MKIHDVMKRKISLNFSICQPKRNSEDADWWNGLITLAAPFFSFFHFALQIFKRQTIDDVSGPSAQTNSSIKLNVSNSFLLFFSKLKSIFHQFPLIEQIIWTRDATRENIRISTPGDARKKIQQSSVGNRFHSHVSDWTSAKWAKMSWFMTIIATQHFSLRPLIFLFFSRYFTLALLKSSMAHGPRAVHSDSPFFFVEYNFFFEFNNL